MFFLYDENWIEMMNELQRRRRTQNDWELKVHLTLIKGNFLINWIGMAVNNGARKLIELLATKYSHWLRCEGAKVVHLQGTENTIWLAPESEHCASIALELFKIGG